MPIDGNRTVNGRSVDTRRRAFPRLGYANGVLWSIGNGLTSGSLITYLAIDLGAEGVGVSMVLAIQSMVGALRILSPTTVAMAGSARCACLALTLASYALIMLLPVTTLTGSPLRMLPPVTTLVVLLCVHQLLEQFGTVAMWTWWSNLVPLPIRGRYFGRRNTLQLAALIPTVWASGWFVDMWKRTSRLETRGLRDGHCRWRGISFGVDCAAVVHAGAHWQRSARACSTTTH